MALFWFDVKFYFFMLFSLRRLFSMAWRAAFVWQCHVEELPNFKLEMADIFAVASTRAGLQDDEVAELKRRYLSREQ